MNDELPPHCEQAEWLLVACALEKPGILLELEPAAFYCSAPRQVLERGQELKSTGIHDLKIPLLMELSRANTELFLRAEKALNDLTSPENWTYYRDEVEQRAAEREAVKLALEIEQEARNGKLDPEAIISRANKLKRKSPDEWILDNRVCANRLVQDIERRFNLQGKRSGLVTGFRGLDELTDGLQFGEQTIIGARPSIGKTALACNFIERVGLRDNHFSAFVTLEMSPAAICRRLLSSFASIPMSKLRTGRLAESEFTAISKFNTMLEASPLRVIDGVAGLNIQQVCTAIRRLHQSQPLKFVVIDYLQKIRPVNRYEKRTYDVGEVSGLLRSLAIETGAAFVTLAQLSRESEKEKGRPPRLSDLADSGQIERDADCVGLLHRDRTTAEAMLIVAKQRDGEIGTVSLNFNGQFCRFENSKTHNNENK